MMQFLYFILPFLLSSPTLAHAVVDAATGGACDPAQIVTRREWGNLRPSERKAYTDAVLCLQSRPSQLSHALYNTTSRYEDFVAVHMNQTRLIHFNGVFLAWHRGFIKIFESTLQTECGYAGALPYWDWIKHHENLTASPLFDGSAFSFSGQGLPLTPEEKELEPDCFEPFVNVTCPNGPGGGCVTDGPFKNYRIGYLPVDGSALTDPNPGLPQTVFAYISRCFTRDLNQYVATNFQTQQNLDNLLSQTTIKGFQDVLDNVSGVGLPGLHASGHFATGPVGGEIFSSPTEPTFFLHHAMIDRVWSQWQSVDPARVSGGNALSGTVTTNNIPPSPNVTFDTLIDWGPLGNARPVRELMAVGFGDMCFEYE